MKVGDLVRYKQAYIDTPPTGRSINETPTIIIGFEDKQIGNNPPRVMVVRADGIFYGSQKQYEVIK